MEQQGSDTGVRKYFFFIKEKISSDWKDLAFHLGFEKPDSDNIDGRNRDDKSRCMDLLEGWLKRNGERATIEVLMEALSEAKLQSTVDGLKNKYAELGKLQTSTSQQKRKEKKEGRTERAEDSLLDTFRESVKKYYELRLTTFKPLIWNDDFTLTLSDIFTELELIRGNRRTSPKESFSSVKEKGVKKLNSSDDLFNRSVTGRSTEPRCILIEGEAGGGKTTFLSKEALDAVSQKTELGRRHDIVLLIRLKEVREGETIEEMVCDQCVPETIEGVGQSKPTEFIRAILLRNEPRVLFLLDGYDELRPEARAATQAIPKLLSGRMYPNSTTVITSRPSAGVQQYARPDCRVNIVGFSPRHVKKYVHQYFTITEQTELASELIRTIDGNQLVTDLMHTPIFLTLVCLTWEEDPGMVFPGTMTGLYDDLLKCLTEKYFKREGANMPTEGITQDVADSILQLGKLALEALLRNETLLDLTEVERENVNWDLLSKLGVVSLEMSASKRHPRKQLNFSHKTMQEFLAGRYVAHALKSQDIVKLLQLTSISKALEHSNLLQFTCGCDSGAAQAVMKELCKLSYKELKDLQADQLDELDWKSPVPVTPEVKKSAETYRRFVLLCLGILNERKEPNVLHAVSRALRVMIINLKRHSRQHAALKYYLERIQSEDLPDRMILCISYGYVHDEVIQLLESTFVRSIPGLRLDLKIRDAPFSSPDQTARLVSVLKNIPGLRALGLLQTGLTPSSLQSLVQGYCHMSLLEELGLSHNPALGDAGMEVLQVGLSRVPHLAVLRLGEVGMTDVGMSSLAPNIMHLSGLRELNIRVNKIGYTRPESLTTVLSKFTAMQVLDLCDTCISATGMHKLVEALRQLTRLINLSIRDNNIGDPGLECLAEILPNLTAMKVLILMNTAISDRGTSGLVKALPHLVELQVLDVSGNRIGDSGIVSVVQTLCQPNSLDMEQNPSSEKSPTPPPNCNTTLRVLRIGFNKGVTGAGLERVAQLIGALPALTGLGMSGSLVKPAHLSGTAAMALAEALPRLPVLEWLYLQGISMKTAGFQAVAQAAAKHPTLERLVYSRRGVPQGADTSASCLKLF
ncbi:NLR family CARD domain-containing protein 4-like [Branchiostoma lanceolatum]|uniref:NLR family CARD domain-containing protein 4-like n=1 Tax=Branchiostoma lanceolatum TaxID=7740 RepID=UPI00345200C4